MRKVIATHLYKSKKNVPIFALPLNLVELLTNDININIVKIKKVMTIKLLKIISKIIDFDNDALIELNR